MADDRIAVLRELVDNQLESKDGKNLSRVADVTLAWRDDGSLVLVDMVSGPVALVRRLSSHLTPLARLIFGLRFEAHIPMTEIETIGPTVCLKRDAAAYAAGDSEHWIVEHILRFIPGSGA